MPQFTYTFGDPPNSSFTVTTAAVPQTYDIDLGTDKGYAITGISGTFNGAEITGLLGLDPGKESGTDDPNDGRGDAGLYDNKIFVNDSQGVFGSSFGIDSYGIGFRTETTDYTLYYDGVGFNYLANGMANPVTITDTNAPCFLTGTLIRTSRGDVAVEDLTIGDTLVSADGTPRPVVWIGRRTIVAAFADPVRSFPIRIQAGALAERAPARDLFLSPDHALLIDGVLVQAGALVNGSTVTRVANPGPRFTYYHVETQDHAVILAEGAAAESFVNSITRRAFDNYAEYEALFGARADHEAMADRDEPRAMSARQVPAGIKARLAARAALLMPVEAVAA